MRSTAQRWAQLAASPAVSASLVIGVLVWGAFVCFWRLGETNLNADEPVYRVAGWAYVHGDSSLTREAPPFAKYLFGFAQLMLGPSELSARIVSAGLCFVTGVAIWALLRADLGTRLALIPAGLWLLLPRGTLDQDIRIDRLGLLEPVMVSLSLLAVLVAWVWYRRSPRSWWLAAVSGVLMGVAVTSKVSIVVILPAFAVLLVQRIDRRLVRDAALFFAGLATTVVVVYLPAGGISSVSYMIRFLREHDSAGHIITVDGQTYTFPPWWSDFWFMVVGAGWPTVLLLGVGTALALVLGRPRRLVMFCSLAMVSLMVFYAFGSRVALPHYYYAWMGLASVTAGIGIAALVRRLVVPRRDDAPDVIPASAGVFGVALLAIAAVIGSTQTAAVAATGPTGIARVAGTLRDAGLARTAIVVDDVTPFEWMTYLPRRVVTDPAQIESRRVEAIVVGADQRFPADPRVAGVVADPPAGTRVVVLDDVRLLILPARLTLSE